MNMNSMKNLYALTLMMAIVPMVYSQRTINVGDIIHQEFVKAQKKDPFVDYRKKLPFYNKFAVNKESDTIFVIESLTYSEYEPHVSVSCWTSHSLFSARQEESKDIVFKIKNENRFEQWLMDNVQTWNTDSLSSLGPPVIPHNEEIAGTLYAYRIILNKGKIALNSIEFYPSKRKIPSSEKERDDLWLRWIYEDLDWDEEEDEEDSIIDFSNETIDIRSLIHERIDLEHEDLFKECRDLFTVLKNLPCNIQTDTIYAIEYSLEKGLSEAMYWSDNYVYTIIGTPAHEFRVYPYRHFGRWLVDMVEQWDMTAFQRAQEDVSGSDECYAILRIVIDEGAIITFYKELHKHLSSPNQDWNEQKKPLGGDYISQYDCSK